MPSMALARPTSSSATGRSASSRDRISRMVSPAVRSMISTAVSTVEPGGSARRSPPASTLSENSSWEMESCSSLAIRDRSSCRALASASCRLASSDACSWPAIRLKFSSSRDTSSCPETGTRRSKPPSATSRVSAASRLRRRISRRVDSSPNASPAGTATASTTRPVLTRPGETVNPPIPGAAAGTSR